MPDANHFPARSARRPYRFFVEAVLFLSYFVFGLSWIGYTPFLGEIQARYALSYAAVSLVISTVSFSKIFMPFLSGWIASRLGIRHALTAGLLLICASCFTPFATSFPGILVSRFIFGLGGAMVVTLIGSAIMQWFPKEELPIVNGFNYVAVNSGITASLFLTIPLTNRLGQRVTLLTYAGASVLLALLWVFGGRARETAVSSKSPEESYWPALRQKETWLLAIGFLGPLALYLSLNTWLPTFYAQIFGFNKVQSARLTGLFNLAGIPAAILGGFVTRRVARRKPLIWIPAALMSISALALFLIRDPQFLPWAAAIFGASLFLWISPLSTLAMELPGMTPGRFGMTMGMFYSVSYLGAFFAPALVGALRDMYASFLPGFLIVALASWSMAFCSFFLPETGKLKSPRQMTQSQR